VPSLASRAGSPLEPSAEGSVAAEPSVERVSAAGASVLFAEPSPSTTGSCAAEPSSLFVVAVAAFVAEPSAASALGSVAAA
jgi:hypothetical protein